ncbi:MAG: LacI family transcriptional regulator [Propionibacteriaceae bacterium]|jgi:DNA-binding LacI/PurR family transcriptional regulator|nr:LacI family transcriptional regulator [Propionibacteriaceae bacterium]
MSKVHRVTLDDVAQAAGVARATASRALTGSGPVSQTTRTRVEAAAAQLRFSPHQAARALASSQAQAIALVIPEPDAFILGDPFLSYVIMGVSEVFHDTTYQLILVIAHPDDPPTKISQVLRPGYVDGAIVVSQHGSGQIAQAIDEAEIPIVYIGRPWSGQSLLYVDVDNRAVGHIATAHLLRQGSRRIACIAGPVDMSPVDDRTSGWRAALSAAGVEPGPLRHSPFTASGGEVSMRSILESGEPFDAVFAQSDLMAAGAVRVLTEADLDVPGQVRVVGVDDAEVGRATSPPLTSVTNPAEELARGASHMLLSILDGEMSSEQIHPQILNPRLIVRESA